KAESSLPVDSFAREKILGCLAEVGSLASRYDEALVYQGRLLQDQVATLGPRHPRVGDGLRNLGIALFHLGRYRDSLVVRLCGHALIVENWGADGFEAARSWAGLANVWSHMHEGPRARDAIDRATAIVDRIRGAGDWGHIEI